MINSQIEIANIKCIRCRCYRFPKQFVNAKGRVLKTCDKCRIIANRYNAKNKAKRKQYYEEHKDEIKQYHKQHYEEHKAEIKEQQKQYYEEHKDEIKQRTKQYYYEHKDVMKEKQKRYYEEHKDKIKQYKKQHYEEHKDEIKQYYEEHKCPHGLQPHWCKRCSDPFEITIKRMIRRSKRSDKKCNRYDANNFIDRCFLEGLIEEYTHCYWNDCKIKLQYVEYQHDLATIERLNNSIGHTKSNCVLACKKCNCMRKSDRN